MAYCPRCRQEYAESVQRCLDCDLPLRPGHRPAPATLELEDAWIPLGAFVCLWFAIGMLYLRIGAQFGWIHGTLATLVQLSQPPCMTAFYLIAALACAIVFSLWLVRVLIERGRRL